MALEQTVQFIILFAGIIYGFLKPGKEDRKSLFKKGFLLGVVAALLIAGLIIISGISSMAVFVSSEISIVLGIVYLTVLFIAGTFIGDWLEGNIKPTTKS